MSRRIWAVLVAWALLVPCGICAISAPISKLGQDQESSDSLVELTIDLAWKSTDSKATSGPSLMLYPSSGKLLEVAVMKGDEATSGPLDWGFRQLKILPDGSCELGSEKSARVRARVQMPVSGAINIQATDSRLSSEHAKPGRSSDRNAKADLVRQVPLSSILEGPKRIDLKDKVQMEIQRTPWDSIEVQASDRAKGFRGIAAPGAVVPIQVGLNVLSPIPTEVEAKISVELRPAGSESVAWRDEQHARVPTNTAKADRPTWLFEVQTPHQEGTYVLEIKTTWEPAVAENEGNRLSRLLRRWRAGNAARTMSRRVTLAVVSPASNMAAKVRSQKPFGDESLQGTPIDLAEIGVGRGRSHRNFSTGRSGQLTGAVSSWGIPVQAFEFDRKRGERIKGLLGRTTATDQGWVESAQAGNLAWLSTQVHVTHPGRPHRLTISIDGGDPKSLGVALAVAPAEGRPGRMLLDAAAAGLPILENGPPETFSWFVWPDHPEPVCVVVNRGEAPFRIARIQIEEFDELPDLRTVASRSFSDRRTLALDFSGSEQIGRFGGALEPVGGLFDGVQFAENLAGYAGVCGASTVVVPEYLADRESRSELAGQTTEDCIGPDRLELLLEILRIRGMQAWIEIDPDGSLPGLPAPASKEALALGLVQVDGRGVAVGPSFQPLNPKVQAAFMKKVQTTLAMRNKLPALSGVVLRIGSGATVPGSARTGLDDQTFARFVADTFDETTARRVPGIGDENPSRFAERSKFLGELGRMPWLSWRSRRLGAFYAEMAKVVEASSPGATLAVVTPGFDEGQAGFEARSVERQGLSPLQAWRAVGLGLDQWPVASSPLVVLRGMNAFPFGPARDLSTSPELDQLVTSCPNRGVMITLGEPEAVPSTRKPGLVQTVLPIGEGAAGDEFFGHAVAVLDARWVVVGVSAALGQEDRLRRFEKVFSSLPTPGRQAPSNRQSIGVAVRPVVAGKSTYVELANDAPYTVRIELALEMAPKTRIDDLGREASLTPEPTEKGGRVVLDLAPYGVSVLRVADPHLKLASVSPRPTPAVLAEVKAKARELSERLERLSKQSQDAKGALETRPVVLTIPPPSAEVERSQVHRILLAALQAYQDERLADFARLAGSHWIHQSQESESSTAPAYRTGAASGLPSSGRLR